MKRAFIAGCSGTPVEFFSLFSSLPVTLYEVLKVIDYGLFSIMWSI